MKLGYQQATIGFCVDLTSPTSEVIPIANLLVGEAEGRQVAGVALLVPEHLDPLTKRGRRRGTLAYSRPVLAGRNGSRRLEARQDRSRQTRHRPSALGRGRAPPLPRLATSDVSWPCR
jgi:hypothetical protein